MNSVVWFGVCVYVSVVRVLVRVIMFRLLRVFEYLE